MVTVTESTIVPESHWRGIHGVYEAVDGTSNEKTGSRSYQLAAGTSLEVLRVNCEVSPPTQVKV